MSRVRAADVYLVKQCSKHTEQPMERRNKIFRESIKLGMRGRWKYHAQAEDFLIGNEGKEALQYRTPEQTSVAFWLTENVARVLFTRRELESTGDELDWCTDWREGERSATTTRWMLYLNECTRFLHLIILTMWKRLDKKSVIRLRGSVAYTGSSISSVRLYGSMNLVTQSRRRSVIKPSSRAAPGVFDGYKPSESSWWAEATRVGKYATDEWWH